MSFKELKNRITIYLIKKFGKIKEVDLQQTEKIECNVIYYYYGRYVKLVRRKKKSIDFLKRLKEKGNNIVFGHSRCRRCALHQMSLPCEDLKKSKDMCLNYYFKKIKHGKN
jgi:hypothetical protein